MNRDAAHVILFLMQIKIVFMVSVVLSTPPRLEIHQLESDHVPRVCLEGVLGFEQVTFHMVANSKAIGNLGIS